MRGKAAVIVLTLYLVVFTALCYLQASFILLSVMFGFAPVLLVATVFIVLKDKSRPYAELKEKEEWGYRDKRREEIGIL